MPNYAGLADKKEELIRKAKDGSLFIAPVTATAITNLTTGSGADLAALPTGYKDLGLLTTDGATYARATEQSEIRSFGSAEATRTDVTADTITLNATAQETRLVSIGLYTGADIAAIQAASVTGELQIAKPDRPAQRFYRCLGLFVDDTEFGELYMARWMPRARITEFGDQAYGESDEALGYPCTLTGFRDSTLGYSHKWIWGGPGWKGLLTAMGIPQAA